MESKSGRMAERGESSDEEPTIAEDVVVTKYKMAGDMANSTSGFPFSLLLEHTANEGNVFVQCVIS